MAALGLLDRLREFLTSRRFAWILLILAAVLVVFYFLFVTFFFDPFESPLEDTAAVVPADADWFLRWQGMGEQIGEFPVPKVFEELRDDPAWQEAERAGAVDALAAASGLAAVGAELAQAQGLMPAGLDLRTDLLRELAVAGRGRLGFDRGFDGMVMMRVSFKVKAGIAFLGFDTVRKNLPETLQIESLGDGIYRLPQFQPFGYQDAYLAMLRDVMLIASRREWIDRARELEARSGQDSLAQSSLFLDHVTAWLTPADRPIEFFLRWGRLKEQLGSWPAPNAPGLVSQAVGRVFRTDFLRNLAGFVLLGERLHARASGDLDTSGAGDFAKGWLESSPVGAYRIRDFARMAPADSFLFMTVAGDPTRLFVEAYDVLVPDDLRQPLEELVLRGGRYQGMLDLLRNAGEVFKPGMCVVLRRNDYPPADNDPEHDDTPVPLFAVIGRVRDAGRYEELRSYFERNWSSFTGGAEASQQDVRMMGDALARSFVSPIVPGTGEILITRVPTLEVAIVSNSAKFVDAILRAAFADPDSPAGRALQLAARPGFEATLEDNPNGAQFLVYLDPQEARGWLEALDEAVARERFLAEQEAAWRRLRPEETDRQRQRLFGGRTNLSPVEEQRLQDAVDEALLARDLGADRRIAELVEQARAAWLPAMVLDWASLGFRTSRRTASLVLDARLGTE